MIGRMLMASALAGAALVGGAAWWCFRPGARTPVEAAALRGADAIDAAGSPPAGSRPSGTERTRGTAGEESAVSAPETLAVRELAASPARLAGAAEAPAAPAPAAPAPQAVPAAGPRATPLGDAELSALVDALRDDGIRGNAMHAVDALIAEGRPALPALERALRSTDEQQRTLAACACRCIPGHARSPELARVLLATLTPRPGERLREITRRPWICHVGRAGIDEPVLAFEAFESDAELFGLVEGEFEARLYGSDPVLRFDAARIVLAHPGARSRPAARDALLVHLESNALSDDAAVAMRLLAREGADAVPAVRAALPGRDAQSARLLAHFLARFDPTHPAARALAPKELARMGFFCGDMLASELERR